MEASNMLLIPLMLTLKERYYPSICLYMFSYLHRLFFFTINLASKYITCLTTFQKVIILIVLSFRLFCHLLIFATSLMVTKSTSLHFHPNESLISKVIPDELL